MLEFVTDVALENTEGATKYERFLKKIRNITGIWKRTALLCGDEFTARRTTAKAVLNSHLAKRFRFRRMKVKNTDKKIIFGKKPRKPKGQAELFSLSPD